MPCHKSGALGQGEESRTLTASGERTDEMKSRILFPTRRRPPTHTEPNPSQAPLDHHSREAAIFLQAAIRAARLVEDDPAMLAANGHLLAFTHAV